MERRALLPLILFDLVLNVSSFFSLNYLFSYPLEVLDKTGDSSYAQVYLTSLFLIPLFSKAALWYYDLDLAVTYLFA